MIEILNEIDFPALVLMLMLVGMVGAMAAAQKNPNFDWSEGFKDEKGKVSFTRALGVGGFAVSSWGFIYVVMNGMRTSYNADDLVKVLAGLYWWFVLYMFVWAGTKSADKLIDVLHDYVRLKAGQPVSAAPELMERSDKPAAVSVVVNQAAPEK